MYRSGLHNVAGEVASSGSLSSLYNFLRQSVVCFSFSVPGFKETISDELVISLDCVIKASSVSANLPRPSEVLWRPLAVKVPSDR